MDPHPQEIYVDGHDLSHGSLKRRRATSSDPARCSGCRETVLVDQQCYCCGHPNCDYRIIHEGCAPTVSIRLGLVKCDFKFQQKPPAENNKDCDACGRRVNGWCFRGDLRGRTCYLHPCCARLDFKRENQAAEGLDVVLDLKETSSLTCALCRNKGHSKTFKSWVYVSRCKKYCYHVSCVNHKVVEWKQDEVGTSSSSGDLVKWSMKEALDAVGILVDVFNFVSFLIFGVGIPVPLKALRALLLKK